MLLIKKGLKTGLTKIFKNKSFLGNLCLLLIILGLTIWLGKDRIWTKTPTSFFSDDINSYCINLVCVSSDNSKWYVKKDDQVFKADSEVVENWIKVLKDIKLDEVVSNNKNNNTLYGFDSNQVVLEVNGKKIEIGRINSSYDGTYVKKIDNDEIFGVDKIINKELIGDFDYWLDKKITNWSVEEIESLSVNNGRRTTSYDVKKYNFEIAKLGHLIAEKVGVNPDTTKSRQWLVEAKTDFESYKLVIGMTGNEFFATTDNKLFYKINNNDWVALQKILR